MEKVFIKRLMLFFGCNMIGFIRFFLNKIGNCYRITSCATPLDFQRTVHAMAFKIEILDLSLMSYNP